jgi:hypothetical protein
MLGLWRSSSLLRWIVKGIWKTQQEEEYKKFGYNICRFCGVNSRYDVDIPPHPQLLDLIEQEKTPSPKK